MHHIQVAKLFLFTFKRGIRITSIPVWLLSNIVSGALPIVVFILSLLYTLPRGISFNTNYRLERYISKLPCMVQYRTKSVLFNVIQVNKIKFNRQIFHYQLRGKKKKISYLPWKQCQFEIISFFWEISLRKRKTNFLSSIVNDTTLSYFVDIEYTSYTRENN